MLLTISVLFAGGMREARNFRHRIFALRPRSALRRTPYYQYGHTRVPLLTLHRFRTIRRVASMPSRRSLSAWMKFLCIWTCCGSRLPSLSNAPIFSLIAFSAISNGSEIYQLPERLITNFRAATGYRAHRKVFVLFSPQAVEIYITDESWKASTQLSRPGPSRHRAIAHVLERYAP